MRGLLDALKARAGCLYLSDLPGCWRERLTRGDVTSLPPDGYTAREWNDALHYLTGEPASYSTAPEARDALLAKLGYKQC